MNFLYFLYNYNFRLNSCVALTSVLAWFLYITMYNKQITNLSAWYAKESTLLYCLFFFILCKFCINFVFRLSRSLREESSSLIANTFSWKYKVSYMLLKSGLLIQCFSCIKPACIFVTCLFWIEVSCSANVDSYYWF